MLSIQHHIIAITWDYWKQRGEIIIHCYINIRYYRIITRNKPGVKFTPGRH